MATGNRIGVFARVAGQWRWGILGWILWICLPAWAGQGTAARRFALRLQMAGYRPSEIREILSGERTLAQIDRRIRLRAMGCTDAEIRAMTAGESDPVVPRVSGDGSALLRRRVAPYLDVIYRAAHRHGVPPSLVMAVIGAESGFDPRAISPTGALGLMQLMPATARALGVADPFDPGENISAGTRYLARCLRAFARQALALAAYNAGPAVVAQRGRVPSDPEVLAYIDRVAAYQRRFRSMHLFRPR